MVVSHNKRSELQVWATWPGISYTTLSKETLLSKRKQNMNEICGLIDNLGRTLHCAIYNTSIIHFSQDDLVVWYQVNFYDISSSRLVFENSNFFQLSCLKM